MHTLPPLSTWGLLYSCIDSSLSSHYSGYCCIGLDRRWPSTWSNIQSTLFKKLFSFKMLYIRSRSRVIWPAAASAHNRDSRFCRARNKIGYNIIIGLHCDMDACEIFWLLHAWTCDRWSIFEDCFISNTHLKNMRSERRRMPVSSLVPFSVKCQILYFE